MLRNSNCIKNRVCIWQKLNWTVSLSAFRKPLLTREYFEDCLVSKPELFYHIEYHRALASHIQTNHDTRLCDLVLPSTSIIPSTKNSANARNNSLCQLLPPAPRVFFPRPSPSSCTLHGPSLGYILPALYPSISHRLYSPQYPTEQNHAWETPQPKLSLHVVPIGGSYSRQVRLGSPLSRITHPSTHIDCLNWSVWSASGRNKTINCDNYLQKEPSSIDIIIV